MRWAWHVRRMGEKGNTRMLLVGKPEGKRPPRSPRRRWVDSNKINFRQDGVMRIGLVWLRIGTSG
jgi:hypothetical protein